MVMQLWDAFFSRIAANSKLHLAWCVSGVISCLLIYGVLQVRSTALFLVHQLPRVARSRETHGIERHYPSPISLAGHRSTPPALSLNSPPLPPLPNPSLYRNVSW